MSNPLTLYFAWSLRGGDIQSYGVCNFESQVSFSTQYARVDVDITKFESTFVIAMSQHLWSLHHVLSHITHAYIIVRNDHLRMES